MPGSPPVHYDYAEAFARNLGLVTADEQARLRRARVAVAGLGGVGGIHLLALARLGIGAFSIADLDSFELANINRQVGATVATVGRSKIETMAEMVAAINPTADIRLFPKGIDPSTVDDFLEGAVAAVDGVDFFTIAVRRLLFARARALGIHALTSGPVGFGATLHVFSPSGMSFDEYFDIHDEMTTAEQTLQFGLGLAPKMAHWPYFRPSTVDFSGQRAPSMGSACLLCAGLVTTEILNLILRKRPLRVAPCYFQFDPLVQRYKTGRLRWGNRSPIQRLKKWWILRSSPTLRDAIRPGPRP